MVNEYFPFFRHSPFAHTIIFFVNKFYTTFIGQNFSCGSCLFLAIFRLSQIYFSLHEAGLYEFSCLRNPIQTHIQLHDKVRESQSKNTNFRLQKCVILRLHMFCLREREMHDGHWNEKQR